MSTPIQAAAWWRRFLFEPEPATPLAVVRILYGVILTAWALAHLVDLEILYGPDGVMPHPELGRGMWPLLPTSTPVPVLTGLVLLLVVAGLLVAVGLWTRPAALIGFLVPLALQRRSPIALNSGDLLLRVIGLSVLLGDAGAALSIDRWRSHRYRFWIAPLRAPWALRMLQVQLSFGYLITVVWKWTGWSWQQGLATGYALQLEDLRRFAAPEVFWSELLLLNLMTYGALFTEIVVAIGIWHPRARRYVVPLGIAMHLSIDLFLTVGFFSWLMYCMYLAFVPPVRDVRDVVPARWRSKLRAPAPATVERAV